MNNLNFFSEKINVTNKRVIVRFDLNVPLKNGKIIDDTRIKMVKPFLEKLIKKKAKIIIVSHLGRPKGKRISKLSLKPIYNYLIKKTNFRIKFHKGLFSKKLFLLSKKIKSGQILLIENIRFNKLEELNDADFAQSLSKLGDVYINEAFSCSHRKQASVHKITKFIRSYCGPLFEKEIKSINYLIKNKKRPITCIIGGSKISTKIGVLSNLIKNSDNLIIVGAMANNFLKYNGFEIGASLVEKKTKNIIRKIYLLSKKHKCKILIPFDFMISKKMNGNSTYRSESEIGNDEIILDIGKNTINSIKKLINRSRTIFWNGPAGYYENKKFLKGTRSLALSISEKTRSRQLISIVGGGDTIAAIKKTKIKTIFTHLSTAGGAFLESLEGKELPGIKVLKR